MQSVEPEREIVRRALPFLTLAVPVAFLIGSLLGGVDAGVSAAIGAAVVAVNFVVNAFSQSRAARVSPGFLGAVTAIGFVARMAVIFGTLFLLSRTAFFSPVAFVLAVVPLSLFLLAFEIKLAAGPMGRRIDIPDEAVGR